MSDETNQPGASIDMFSAISPMLLLSRNNNNGGNGGSGLSMEILLLSLMPLLMSLFKTLWSLPALKGAWKKFGLTSNKVLRTISITRTSSWWRDSDELRVNFPIQKAILHYINKYLPDKTLAWKQADVQAKKKSIPVNGGSASASNNSCRDGGSESDDEGCHDGVQIEEFGYMCSPPEGDWVSLGHGVELMRTVKNEGEKVKEVTTSFSLRGSTSAKINTFLEKALEEWNKELASKVDHARYLYVPTMTMADKASAAGEDGKGSAPPALYKRYKYVTTRHE